MAYKCLECGHIFERGEEDSWSEYRGECFGFAAYEEMSGCPLCQGVFEETVPCGICGSEHLLEELNGASLCDECFDYYKDDFEMCYEIAKSNKCKVKINGLLASIFTENQIEEILVDYVKNEIKGADLKKFVSDFVEADVSWYVEMLEEEVKKNENAKG